MTNPYSTEQHECPQCGKLTHGSYSEGGIKWSLCEDCLINSIESAKIEAEQWARGE